ncbi:MAG: T9SS type A sorting domain-containing protein [Ignavibacteriales bacterium]|nr:T9SS type A sorting domain-containing protein [Ignavibacteriales bacterium]
MYYNQLKRLLITLIFLVLGSATIFSQTLVLSDALSGSTQGQRYGGTLTSEGYQPGTGENHILYKLNQIPNGYVEFEMTGFRPSSVPVGEDHGFLAMYDGRGINEPASYFGNFKFNFFRWNLHWRQNRAAFKSVVNLASPSTSNNSNIGYWVQVGSEDPRDYDTEPTGTGFSWNSSAWTKIKVEWRNKQFKVYANGQLVWNSSGPYDYAPKDFRIWLGSGPGKYNSDVSGQTFRNFKVYSYGGVVTPVDELSISPSSQNVASSAGNTNISVSSNVSWSASDNASWLSLSPTSGSNNGSITATFQENTSSSSRTATVTVSGSGITRTATITQNGTSSTTNNLSISPSSQNVASSAGNTNISVSSNVSWSASDNASWLSLSPTSGSNNGSITATFQENTSSSSRTATVTVSGSGITRTATITQNGISAPPPTGGDLMVTSPSAGQSLVPGSVHQIMWSGPSSIASVGLYFSSNGGEDWTTIAGSTPNDGNFTWTVPNVISNSCIVRVKDTKDWSHYDRSDIFKISKDGTPPPPPTGDKLMVTSPSAGQTLVPGSVHQIMWSGPSSVTNVGLYFSSNGGEDWTTIAGSTPSDGNFSWTVPNVISNSCIVRVKDTKEWSHYDRSDIFKISKDGTPPPPPTDDELMVTSPSAGQSLVPGSVHQITWVGPSSVTNVGLYFSTNGGENWTQIASSTSNDGNFSWTVPNVNSNNCIVRVKDTKEWSHYDRSDIFSVGGSSSLAKDISNSNSIESNLPEEFALLQNYPNPFNPTTNIQFALPEGGYTELVIYNSLGQEVQKLISEFKSEGTYSITFNAKNLPSGIYFYSLRSGNFFQTNKMLLLE